MQHNRYNKFITTIHITLQIKMNRFLFISFLNMSIGKRLEINFFSSYFWIWNQVQKDSTFSEMTSNTTFNRMPVSQKALAGLLQFKGKAWIR